MAEQQNQGNPGAASTPSAGAHAGAKSGETPALRKTTLKIPMVTYLDIQEAIIGSDQSVHSYCVSLLVNHRRANLALASLTALEQQLIDRQDQLNQVIQQRAELQTQLDQAHQLRDELQTQLETAQATSTVVSDPSTRPDETAGQLETLQNRLIQANEVAESMQEVANTYQAERERLETQVSQLTTQLESLKEEKTAWLEASQSFQETIAALSEANEQGTGSNNSEEVANRLGEPAVEDPSRMQTLTQRNQELQLEVSRLNQALANRTSYEQTLVSQKVVEGVTQAVQGRDELYGTILERLCQYAADNGGGLVKRTPQFFKNYVAELLRPYFQ